MFGAYSHPDDYDTNSIRALAVLHDCVKTMQNVEKA